MQPGRPWLGVIQRDGKQDHHQQQQQQRNPLHAAKLYGVVSSHRHPWTTPGTAEAIASISSPELSTAVYRSLVLQTKPLSVWDTVT